MCQNRRFELAKLLLKTQQIVVIEGASRCCAEINGFGNATDVLTLQLALVDPYAHATRMTAANDMNDGKLKPVIKMVKHWSRNNYDRLSSFHIELICADIFSTEDIGTYQVGVATVLVHLSKYINLPMLDPVYRQCRADKKLSPTEASEQLLRANSDARRAVDALNLENAGRQDNAIAKWKEVFLAGFPR